MIQRIQTIYLLVAVILMALSYAFNVLIGIIDSPVKSHVELSLFGLNGTSTYQPSPLHLVLPVLVACVMLLQVWGIFAFSRLKRQGRIVLWSCFFILGYYGVLIYEYFHMKSQIAGHLLPDLAAVFPLVSLIFACMAWRAIGRDYKLIRSVDRIR